MKIYTKTGDDGTTGLFGGDRVAKSHTRIEAYGTVDELNAVIGLIRSELPSVDAFRELDETLRRLQMNCSFSARIWQRPLVRNPMFLV